MSSGLLISIQDRIYGLLDLRPTPQPDARWPQILQWAWTMCRPRLSSASYFRRWLLPCCAGLRFRRCADRWVSGMRKRQWTKIQRYRRAKNVRSTAPQLTSPAPGGTLPNLICSLRRRPANPTARRLRASTGPWPWRQPNALWLPGASWPVRRR